MADFFNNQKIYTEGGLYANTASPLYEQPPTNNVYVDRLGASYETRGGDDYEDRT